jgi:hypothetical protein
LTIPAAIHTYTQMPGGDEHAMRLTIVGIEISFVALMAPEIIQRQAENRIFPGDRDYRAHMVGRQLPVLDPAFLPRCQGDHETLRRARRRRLIYKTLVANRPDAFFSR